MEGAAKGKKESTRDSLVRKLKWSLVFFALLTICTCFSFGLELLRRRLNGLEETGVELKEVCSKIISNSNKATQKFCEEVSLE